MGKAMHGFGKMRGKMGKQRGKGGLRVVDIDNWKGLTDPAIRRLLRKGGVTRTNADIYDEARDVTKSFREDDPEGRDRLHRSRTPQDDHSSGHQVLSGSQQDQVLPMWH